MLVEGTLREVIKRHEDCTRLWQMKVLAYIGCQEQPITMRDMGAMISHSDERGHEDWVNDGASLIRGDHQTVALPLQLHQWNDSTIPFAD